jgi:hypothetical protein
VCESGVELFKMDLRFSSLNFLARCCVVGAVVGGTENMFGGGIVVLAPLEIVCVCLTFVCFEGPLSTSCGVRTHGPVLVLAKEGSNTAVFRIRAGTSTGSTSYSTCSSSCRPSSSLLETILARACLSHLPPRQG